MKYFLRFYAWYGIDRSMYKSLAALYFVKKSKYVKFSVNNHLCESLVPHDICIELLYTGKWSPTSFFSQRERLLCYENSYITQIRKIYTQIQYSGSTQRRRQNK